MDLKSLSNDQLHREAKVSAFKLREESVRLIQLLAEIEKRRLFAEPACDSLFDYCIRTLKMSDASAARYVNSSRLVARFPGLISPLKSGSLSLTTLSMAQVFFRREAKAGNEITRDRQIEILRSLKNLSSREVERSLVKRAANPATQLREHVRVIDEGVSELKLIVDDSLLVKLNILKDLWSHKVPGASYAEVIALMADVCLSKTAYSKSKITQGSSDSSARNELLIPTNTLGEKQKSASAEKRDSLLAEKRDSGLEDCKALALDELTPAPELKKLEKQLDLKLEVREDARPSKRSRYISSAIRMTVWMRDGGCCGFTDAKTGLRCGSRHQLELDHVKPFALGGENSIENLRLRCRTHNQWTAAQTYGAASTKFRRAIVRENVVAYAS